MVAALAFGAFGCELITHVDRNKIDGVGGSGGSAPQCSKAEDCVDPGNECVARTCDSGKCGTTNVAAGTAIAAQTKGDCKVTQCDGAGKTADASDDLDVPTDANPCTDDACTGGVPSNLPAASGTACGTALVCDSGGLCVGCVDATTCPGQDNECSKRTCDAGICGTGFTAAGFVVAAQTAGDCQQKQCDGAGAVHTVPDNTDLPVDGNECTSDLCTVGAPSNPPIMAGGVCTTPGNTVCDGAGKCVECNVASTCPGVDNECQARTCIAGVCGVAFTAAGTVAATQTAGDCLVNKCDGAGASKPVVNDLDLPDDSNPCTNDVCTSGVASHPSAPAGTACGMSQACNGAGACTGCVTAATCPGSDTECQTRTCAASVCGVSFTAAGTATNAQATGDCKKNQCNGAGAIVSATDNSDVPVDANACTSDVCTNGAPSNPPTASGSACNQMGGVVCNGASVCVQCVAGANCASGVCNPVTGTCSAPSCTDAVKNGSETGPDCGGGVCPSCGLGVACSVAGDCASGICTSSVCAQVNGCDLTNAVNLTGVASTSIAFGGGLGNAYAPSCIKVTVGTNVTFNGAFDVHPLLGGQVVGNVGMPSGTGPFTPVTNGAGQTTATFAMSATGTFPYYCTNHTGSGVNGMSGAAVTALTLLPRLTTYSNRFLIVSPIYGKKHLNGLTM